AQVELTRVDSWQPVSKRFTDSTGHFGFAGLPAGEYSLKLTARGWQEQLFPHLKIRAARALDVDIVLMPASPNHGRQTGAIQLRDRDILVGSKYGDVPLHALPTTRRIWSLLENQESSTVTERLDTGGLETGARTLFGACGVSWTENEYSLNGYSTNDPYLPGEPLTDPDFGSLANVTVVSAAKSAAYSGSGVNLILSTPPNSATLQGDVRGFFSSRGLQSDNMDARLVQLGFPGPERFRYLVDTGGELSGKLPLGQAIPFFASFSTQQLSKRLGGFGVPIDA